jgi:hypothetical protein
MFMSTHMIYECFSDAEVPDTWKMHFKVLSAPGSKYSTTVVVCDRDSVGRATAEDWFGDHRDMKTSWETLVKYSQNLPAVVKQVHDEYDTKMGQQQRNAVRLHRTSLAETLASILSFTHGSRKNVFSGWDVPMRGPLYEWKHDTEARSLVGNTKMFHDILRKLLPSVGYYFTASSATVVAMIAEGSVDDQGYVTEEAASAMIAFGRILALQVMDICGWSVCPGQKLVAALVPHKRQVLKMLTLRQCKSMREALMVTAETDKSDMSNPCLYTYLGGGVPHQPPQGYGLVFRGMPHALANTLCALLLVYAKSPADVRLFVPKKAMEFEERAVAVAQRIAAVERLCSEIEKSFQLVVCFGLLT